MGRLPWSGDRTNDYHREGIFLGLEGMCAKLSFDTPRAHALSGCGILTLGGVGFSLSSSIAGARITGRCSKGEVAGQHRPPRLHPPRLALGFSIQFIVEKGRGSRITYFACVHDILQKETRCRHSS